ncbi:hypothetical protein AK830_g7852 [Neonectria ditissima]|uniref:Condensation domain-containing protein n=1 Tax=Neonectria ditissima TaxID=78410 RepID=A0A0P7BDV9_9HYPO|nr:hypothetical protein AK830_g7852 [Neonectria ditissima]
MSARPVFHPWTKSTAPTSYSRSLATPEFMLSMLNEYALGHNCPYLGVTVSVQQAATSSSGLDAQDLQSRVAQAFIHARWVHPMVACQVVDSKQLSYKVEEAADVGKWASRTVQTVRSEGGWIELHDRLSREVVLPSQDGDCAFLYLILSPEQSDKPQITQFQLLLHVHHGLADGAGLRSMMNEVLIGLTGPSLGSEYSWGEEVERLSPAALDVAVISDAVIKSLAEMPKEIPLPPLAKPAPQGSRPGTAVVTHTFKGAGFLDGVLAAARANDVKLTAIVQAALVLALYDEVKPTTEEACTVLSGFDLRARNLNEPWGQRNAFVGAAVGLEMMAIPTSILDGTTELSGDRFWAVARHVHAAWVSVAQRQDVAAANELRRAATGFIIQGVLASMNSPPSKLGLNVNYVSDPAGTKQFDAAYEGEGLKLVLDHYQLVTDESTPKLSCRSHSWNDELTLCISFNNGRHKKEDVQDLLKKWALVTEALR